MRGGSGGDPNPGVPLQKPFPFGDGGHPGVCRGVHGITPGCVGPLGATRRRLRGAGRPHRAWVRSGAGREAAAPLCPAHTPPPALTPTLTPAHTHPHTHTPAHTHAAQPAGSRQHGRAGGGAARCRRLRAARVRGEWGGPPSPSPKPGPLPAPLRPPPPPGR